MKDPNAKDVVTIIVNRIYPLLQPIMTAPEAAAAQAQIRHEVQAVIDEMRIIRAAMMAETHTRMAQEMADAVAAAAMAARADEQNKALETVRLMRAEERAACATLRQQDVDLERRAADQRVTAARADEQQKCAALRQQDATAAASAQASAVAAARTDERAKCVAEIQAAPVTGITVALTVFAASMRTQIKTYVATGPH